MTKVAVVTGAGSGIGEVSARALAKVGYAVVLAGRRLEPLEELANGISAAGGQALAKSADVGDPADVAALFKATTDSYGRLDVLFNNAGAGTPPVPFEDLTYEQWSSTVAVNLTGAFLCSQEAFRLFKAQDPRGGRIINNGSISAHVPRPLSAPYTATKHAITGLTRATSLDGRPFDIAVGQIDIGNAATPMTERMAAGVLQADGSTAPEPTMDVQHVADAVVQMAELPLASNIQFMTIMSTQMPYIGRG